MFINTVLRKVKKRNKQTINIIKDKDIAQNLKVDLLLQQYQLLSESRISHDGLLWEVPMMFLTGQAFLLTIALSNDDNHLWWARATAAFISAIFGFLSIQVFERNRVMVVADTEQMLDIEQYLTSIGYEGLLVNEEFKKRRYMSRQYVQEKMERRGKVSFLGRAGSFPLWRIGMYLTTVISASIFLWNIVCRIAIIQHYAKLINENLIAIAFLFLAFDIFLYIMTLIVDVQGKQIKLAFLWIRVCIVLCHNYVIIYLVSPLLSISLFHQIQALFIFLISNGMILISRYFKKKRQHDINVSQSKVKHSKIVARRNEVYSIVLAGGESQRLVKVEVIERNTPKFLAIRYNDKSLLDNTLRRNKPLVQRQFIISTKNICDAYSVRMKKITQSDDVDLLIEPRNRGTGVAILHAVIRILAMKKATELPNDDSVIIITPSDQIIYDEDAYHAVLKAAVNAARSFAYLYILGTPPLFPTQEFGYFSIQPDYCNTTNGPVVNFHEKPTIQEANSLMDSSDTFWNCGIFIARLSVLKKLFLTYEEGLFNGISKVEAPDEAEIYKNQYSAPGFERMIIIPAVKKGLIRGIKARFDWVDAGTPETLERALIESNCELDEDLVCQRSITF